MAEGSKREQIILQIITELEEMASIKMVQRVRPSIDDLSIFSSASLPLVAIESGLPLPIQKKSSRAGGEIDLFVSELEVKLFCYALANVDSDSLISNLADDLWSKLYSDVNHNGLCLGTSIEPQIQTAIWHPYIAFNFKVILTYTHSIGGI